MLILVDRRQRLSEKCHPSIENVLEDGRQRPLAAVLLCDDDLLGTTILAFTPAHLSPPATDWDDIGRNTNRRARPIWAMVLEDVGDILQQPDVGNRLGGPEEDALGLDRAPDVLDACKCQRRRRLLENEIGQMMQHD
jgi:hypothetical protein